MVPNKFNMVDMGGIDIIMSQGIAIEGLYSRLVNSIAQCRYQCLYNWLFDGIPIPPTYVEMEVNEDEEVAINEGVTVSSDDVIHIYSIEPVINQLSVTENGIYPAPEGVDGYNPVEVEVSAMSNIITHGTIKLYSDLSVDNFSSSSNYIEPATSNGNVLDVNWNLPFEIQVTFLYTSTLSRSMVFFGSSSNFYSCPSAEINSNGIWAGLSTNGTTWTNSLSISNSDMELSTNHKYTLKYIYDGTNFTLQCIDGDNIVTKTTQVGTPIHSAKTLEFGGINQSSSHNATYVKLFLKESHIKSENTLVWG